MTNLNNGGGPFASSTRRNFLKGGAALGAAATFSSAVSYARILGANDRIQTGHIGIGNRGESLLKLVVKNCPEAQAVALCDVYQPYLDNARKQAGADAKTFTDYRKLLESKDIDAVVIGSPDHWHAKMFVDACRAGKDVYVEKPLSLVVSEGRKMSEVAKETNRVTQMGAQRHSSPYIIEACNRMREGAIGKITYARCFHVVNEYPDGIGKLKVGEPPPGLDWDMWLGPSPKVPFEEIRWNYKFRWFWNYSGGQMTNFGTHYIDVIQMALGQDAPLAVTAIGGKFAVDDDREIPDTMEALWQYKDCVVAFMQTNANGASASQPGVEIEFRGTKGTLYISGHQYQIVHEDIKDSPYPARGPLAKDEIKRKKVIDDQLVKGEIDQAAHMKNFLSCVKSREKCNCDVETGHRSTSSTLIANVAYRTQTHLQWDRDAEKFKNSDEANKYLSYAYREPWKL